MKLIRVYPRESQNDFMMFAKLWGMTKIGNPNNSTEARVVYEDV